MFIVLGCENETAPVESVPASDVDDLIFENEYEWFVSSR